MANLVNTNIFYTNAATTTSIWETWIPTYTLDKLIMKSLSKNDLDEMIKELTITRKSDRPQTMRQMWRYRP